VHQKETPRNSLNYKGFKVYSGQGSNLWPTD